MEHALIFQSFVARDRFCRQLGLCEGIFPAKLVEECHVETYHRSDNHNVSVNVIVPRVPGGVSAFVDKVSQLCVHFTGRVFVFHAELPQHSDLRNVRHAGLVVNPRVEEYTRALNIPAITDRQRAFLTSFETVTPRQRSPLRVGVPLPPPMVDLDLDSIFAVRDDDLEQAIRNSLNDQEAAASASVNIPLSDDWARVIKKSEPVLPGQPVCLVCLASRASICFVECGHQVACDECVQIMRTSTKLGQNCISCRTEVHHIVRPITSEAAVAVEPVQKKQKCTTKKRK